MSASGYQNAGLTVNAGLDPNPSIKYDGTNNMWLVENGEQGTTDYGSFHIKDVDAAVSALVDSAPATLDTLNELAAALGDDPNFATTTSTALGNRVRFDAAQSLTSAEKTQARSNIGAQVAGNYQPAGSYAPASHNHSASNITSGTLGISRIPTGNTSTTVCLGNDSRLSDARTPTTHTHDDRYYTEAEVDQRTSYKYWDFNDWYAAYSNTNPATLTYDSSNQLARLYSGTDSTIGAVYKAIRVGELETFGTSNPVRKFKVAVRAYSSSNDSDGFYIGLFQYDSDLPAGKHAISNNSSTSESSVVEDTRMSWLRANGSITTSLTTYEYEFTVASTCKWFSIGFLNWSGMGTKSLYFDPSISIKPVVEPYSV